MDKINQAIIELKVIRQNCFICECHNEKLKYILTQLNNFYNSLGTTVEKPKKFLNTELMLYNSLQNKQN